MKPESDGDNVLLGVVLMVLSMATFSTMDTVSKFLTIDYSGIQVTWARLAFHLIPMAIFVGPWRFRRMLDVASPIHQIFRAASFAVSAACIVLAFSLMPLADVIAVVFVSPLLIVALSVPFLGEKVGVHRWIAVAVGFAGVLIIAWPSGEALGPGALLAVASALFWSIGALLTRHVRGDDPWATLFFTALIGTVLLSLVVPFFWRPPSPSAWGLMLVIGLLGGVANALLILAFRHAGASLLAPYSYTQLIWVGLAGWLVFNELPNGRAFLGATVIVVSGLYAWHRERSARPGA